jgi:hypothetical protein
MADRELSEEEMALAQKSAFKFLIEFMKKDAVMRIVQCSSSRWNARKKLERW